MPDDIVIRVEDLGKQYRIGRELRYRTLRETLHDWAAAPFRWLRRGGPAPAPETLWALRHVNLEVKRGEVVGIIGRNGAGKSTLLKILARITEPTEGRVELVGRVGSLLEVGTGFHPELIGRENVFLNGALLGMRRREIQRKFDEIVAFAEIDRFLDTPVKHYSSGMYMRLAFAVAAHLEPEILIVDEVLAVGDAAFQKKCLGKMGAVAREGRTVLFVSHNMAAVAKLCPRTVLLQTGEVRRDGPTAQVIPEYISTAAPQGPQADFSQRAVAPDRVAIVAAHLECRGVPTASLMFGDVASVLIRVAVQVPTRFAVELLLRQADGLPVAFAPSGLAFDWEVDADVGEWTIRADLPPARLARGNYSIDLMLARSGESFYDYLESALRFTIESCAIGARNWAFDQSVGQGHQLWDVRYTLEPEPVVANGAFSKASRDLR